MSGLTLPPSLARTDHMLLLLQRVQTLEARLSVVRRAPPYAGDPPFIRNDVNEKPGHDDARLPVFVDAPDHSIGSQRELETGEGEDLHELGTDTETLVDGETSR